MAVHRHNPTHHPERLMLLDGTWAEVRMLRPEDTALLERGFARLSARSRFQRFLAAKPRLSPEELRYLTAVDGERHVALGAVTWNDAGEEVGLGVARFIRLEDTPEVAELALTVVDDAQGKGLGRFLLDALVRAARERGVERFELRVLADNEAMQRLVRTLGPCEPVRDGETLCFSVPLHPALRGETELLRPLLGLAAQGALTLVGPTCRRRLQPLVPGEARAS